MNPNGFGKIIDGKIMGTVVSIMSRVGSTGIALVRVGWLLAELPVSL